MTTWTAGTGELPIRSAESDVRVASDIRIHRDGPDSGYVLDHGFDLSMLDVPLADRTFSTRWEAERAAESVLAALCGGA